MPPIEKARIERAARIYRSNREAAALGIAPGSFSRRCRRYDIETPQKRRRCKHRQHRQHRQRETRKAEQTQ